MKKFIRGIFSIIISIVLCLILCSCDFLLEEETGSSGVNSQQILEQACLVGGEYNLSESFEISHVEVPLDVQLTLNFSGGEIKSLSEVSITNYGVLVINGGGFITGGSIANFGTLLINGGITFSTNSTAINNQGDLTVNNGTYIVNELNSTGVCLQNEGNAVIENGTFINSGTGYAITSSGSLQINNAVARSQNGVLNLTAGSAVVNNGSYVSVNDVAVSVGEASVTLNAGTYYGKSDYYDLFMTSDNGLLILGKQALAVNGNVFEGNAKLAKIVTSSEELVYALNNGISVALEKDLLVTVPTQNENKIGLVQDFDCNIYGNNYTLFLDNTVEENTCAILTYGGVIQNLSVNGATLALSCTTLKRDLILENVVFESSPYAFVITNDNDQYGMTFTNCTLKGYVSYTGVYKQVSFTNCTFGYSAGYQYLKPTGEVTFTSCIFEQEFEVDSRLATATFVDCYYGETLITEENILSLLGENAIGITVLNSAE